MAISFSILPEQRLVVYSINGTARVEDLSTFLDDVLADPDYRRGYGFFGDRRGLGDACTSEYMNAIGRLLKSHAQRLSPCRWAVMVRGEADFAVVRIWSLALQQTGVIMEPFTLFDRAQAWASGGSRYQESNRNIAAG